MPDEMKGDRSWHEILRRLGVKNPGEVRIQNPVVMTAQVDDLTEVEAPLANNLYGAHATIGANVGQRSGAYLASHGCWVKMLIARHAFWYWTADGTPPALLNLAEVVPRVLGGDAALPPVQRSRLFVARDVVGNWPTPATWTPAFTVGGNWTFTWVTLYLPPGRVLYLTENGDNAAVNFNIWWTEVPPAAAGG